MKKNNTAQKTAFEAEKISKALKEGTEKTLQNLIKEAISDMVDDEDEEEPTDDDSFDVEDVETDENPVDDADGNSDADDAEDGEEGDSTIEDGEGDDADDEWSDMEDFKVGDNDYDFTGVDGETALKVYNKLGDDDQIFVKPEDDVDSEEGEPDAESVDGLDSDDDADNEIELELDDDSDDDDFDSENDDDDFDSENDDEDFDFDSDDDEEIEVDLDDDSDDDDFDSDDDEEIEVDLDDDSDDDELNENLGYTDSYQKDVMPGLKMNEPANKQATYSMDDGAPEGNSKPWAGKGDSKPFGKKVNEGCEDGTCSNNGEQGLEENAGAARTSVKKSHVVKGDKEKPEGFPARGPQAKLDESKVRRIVEAAKAIQAENKQYQNVINKIKQSLYEAAVLNMNYGKIVNLLVNETTTKSEKQSIVERFSSVKTINEGNQLYQSIKRELNESNKKSTPLIDEQISADSSKTINETTIFQQTSANNSSISLMERMDNLYTKKRK